MAKERIQNAKLKIEMEKPGKSKTTDEHGWTRMKPKFKGGLKFSDSDLTCPAGGARGATRPSNETVLS